VTDEPNPVDIRPFGFRAPRFPTSFSFSVELTSSRERVQALCVNISEDGLAAELLQKLAPKTPVTLWLLFPAGTVPLRLQASVEYRQDKQHGFVFRYSSAQQQEQVQAFIQSIRP
jgi:hypothetical protein